VAGNNHKLDELVLKPHNRREIKRFIFNPLYPENEYAW
jgi:hypothetical protein